jgi:hypothetical protein
MTPDRAAEAAVPLKTWIAVGGALLGAFLNDPRPGQIMGYADSFALIAIPGLASAEPCLYRIGASSPRQQ